jgi:hypothetical protein
LQDLGAMQSTLPPELSKLTGLQTFRVAGLQLSGTIPAAYSALTNAHTFVVLSSTEKNDSSDSVESDGDYTFGLTGPIPGSLTTLKTAMSNYPQSLFDIGSAADKLCVVADDDGSSAAVVDMISAGDKTFPPCTSTPTPTPAGNDDTGNNDTKTAPTAAEGGGMAFVIIATVVTIAFLVGIVFVVKARALKTRMNVQNNVHVQSSRRQSLSVRRRSMSMQPLDKEMNGEVDDVDEVGSAQPHKKEFDVISCKTI